MKALIRNPGETILENNTPAFIDWNTGYPLTNSGWAGGAYTLVNDYVQTADEDFAEAPEPEIVTEPAEKTEVITINGKEYTVEEAREILGVKL